MSARPLSRPRRRVLELVGSGRIRGGVGLRPYDALGRDDDFSRRSLFAAQRAGEVDLNVVTGLYFLTDHGRALLRREEDR